MACEEKSGEEQEYHKGEGVIKHGIYLSCLCTDHVEKIFLVEESMVQGLIVLPNFMVNCIYKWFLTRF